MQKALGMVVKSVLKAFWAACVQVVVQISVETEKCNFMIVAGEASGDRLGAKLVQQMRKLAPETIFFGAAGEQMKAAAVQQVFDISTWSVTGVLPVAFAIPSFLSRLRKLARIADERKPDAVILIDFPEFNLKLAKALKKNGHRVIYYVSPQIWAWRKYRARTIKHHVDVLLSILPFEKEWYAKLGIENVHFVGNPIAEDAVPDISNAEFVAKHSIDLSSRKVAFLPGSRKKEIRFHLPVMLEAASALGESEQNLEFLIALARHDQKHFVQVLLDRYPADLRNKLHLIIGETREVLAAADAAAVSSGTATLEAAIIGTPMVIVYKMAGIDAAVLGPLIDVPHIGLVNLVAGKRVVNELVQTECNSKRLTEELRKLLDPENNKKIRSDLAGATEKLGENASRTAAELIINHFGRRSNYGKS